MDFKDKVAIVTGGGSGIGAAITELFTSQGIQVASWDLKFGKSAPQAGVQMEADITDEQSVNQALEKTQNDVGTPHYLINCAGVINGKKLVDKDGSPAPLDHFERVIKVNLIGTYNMMRLIAPIMAENEPYTDDGERGVIINMSSTAAWEGQIGQLSYSASKGGVASMTLPAARELARHGVRVNAIAPGVVDTPMMGDVPENIRERLEQAAVFPKRFARPSEIAELALSILQNPAMNGEIYRIDVGMRMPKK